MLPELVWLLDMTLLFIEVAIVLLAIWGCMPPAPWAVDDDDDKPEEEVGLGEAPVGPGVVEADDDRGEGAVDIGGGVFDAVLVTILLLLLLFPLDFGNGVVGKLTMPEGLFWGPPGPGPILPGGPPPMLGLAPGGTPPGPICGIPGPLGIMWPAPGPPGMGPPGPPIM